MPWFSSVIHTFIFPKDTPKNCVCLFILMFQRSNVFNWCWLENCWKANRHSSKKNPIDCHITSRWIYCQSVSWKGRYYSAPSSLVLNLKMSEKRARVSPAFVYPLPEQQVPVARNSGASSRATSDIFTIKPTSARSNHQYPELLRSTPVKQQGFLRTILRGIRGESSVVDWESLFSPRTCLALWATRQTEKDLRKNKDLYVKTTLRELIIYLVFITVLCISKSLALFDADVIPDEMILSVTFGMTSTKTYYFTSVLRTIFTERKADGAGDKPHFNEINDFDDFGRW